MSHDPRKAGAANAPNTTSPPTPGQLAQQGYGASDAQKFIEGWKEAKK